MKGRTSSYILSGHFDAKIIFNIHQMFPLIWKINKNLVLD